MANRSSQAAFHFDSRNKRPRWLFALLPHFVWFLTIVVLLPGTSRLSSQQPAPDYGKLSPNKIGFDLRIGLNQASVGGILHLSQVFALNPYILYRNQEQTNNFITEPGSATQSTYNVFSEYYVGAGGFIPIYVARVEDLHIRLMPGGSYAAGQLHRSQTSGTNLVFNQSANITLVSFQLLLGLQYALNRYLHIIGELGYSYRETRTPFYVDKAGNLFSGNIGLVFYLN